LFGPKRYTHLLLPVAAPEERPLGSLLKQFRQRDQIIVSHLAGQRQNLKPQFLIGQVRKTVRDAHLTPLAPLVRSTSHQPAEPSRHIRRDVLNDWSADNLTLMLKDLR
jgi:hypothetical protein